MWAVLMAAAAPIELYDSYFLIELIESCNKNPLTAILPNQSELNLLGLPLSS